MSSPHPQPQPRRQPTVRIPSHHSRPDSIDAEHLQQTLETRGWQLIRERIERMIAADVQALETVRAEELQRLQGGLARLRRVLQIPKIIDQEIRAREEKARKAK